jgi:hypothetical protein
VSEVYEIPGRPQHHPLAAGISASALRYYAGNGAGISRYFRHFALFVYDDLLRSFAGDFGRVGANQFLFYGVRVDCGDLGSRSSVDHCSHV